MRNVKAWIMKTSIIYIIGSMALSTALLWSCVKTEIVNLPQEDTEETTEDLSENPAKDTTRVDNKPEPEDTTRYEISFEVTVSEWDEK